MKEPCMCGDPACGFCGDPQSEKEYDIIMTYLGSLFDDYPEIIDTYALAEDIFKRLTKSQSTAAQQLYLSLLALARESN
jgi:hypothetical protein